MDVWGIVLAVYFANLLYRLINDNDCFKLEKNKNLLDGGELIYGNKLFIRRHCILFGQSLVKAQ